MGTSLLITRPLALTSTASSASSGTLFHTNRARRVANSVSVSARTEPTVAVDGSASGRVRKLGEMSRACSTSDRPSRKILLFVSRWPRS